jgi:hypothetical protein
MALDLVALGAPAELVERTYRAALEESAHARAAFTLASAYAGEALGAGRFPGAAAPRDPESPADRLARIVFEAWVDGRVGEAAASRGAALAAETTTDPVVRDVLRAIAADERSHAALAADTLAWARALDPVAFERGASAARAALEEGLAVPPPAVSPALPGRLSADRLRACTDGEARAALEELAQYSASRAQRKPRSALFVSGGSRVLAEARSASPSVSACEPPRATRDVASQSLRV